MTPKWFDSLVKIAPNLKSVNLKVDFRIVDNRKTDNRSIDFGSLNDKEKAKLLQSLPKFFKEGYEFIEAGHEEKAIDYPKKIGTRENRNLIDYFHGKIPEEDLYALKASVYIKGVFDTGGDIKSLRRDLRYRYGRRGTNISNLYTGGYFDTWIKPMYESMSSQNDFDKKTFLEAYNIAVELYPFAIFVNKDMNVTEIKKQIIEKISECQKYGIETLNIHGIGTENTLNITKAIEALKKEMKLDLSIDSKGALYVVKVNLTNM